MSIGNASISGFALVKLSSFDLTPGAFQSLSAQICPAKGTEIPVHLVVPMATASPELRLSLPPSQGAAARLYLCTHPYLLGPMVEGRCAAAWEQVRDLVLTARDQIPPDNPVGIIVPFWEELEFLTQYLRDWHDWKRLAFALIRFDDGAFRNNRQFLKKWNAVLDQLSPGLLRIGWGNISPHFLPLLAYLGFDAVSDFSCVAMADKEIIETPYGRTRPREGPSITSNKDTILLQNQTTLQGMHSEICNRTAQGTLRELVELSTHLDNSIAATLRNFDTAQREGLAPQTRLNKDSPLQCTSVESYFRPELELYRQRLRKRYTVPSYKKLVVLLPCSATKPYRESPSHRKVREIIRRAAGSQCSAIEELVMTSPLGMVPRALEDVYPASFYDVPVTGQWDETEIQISTDLLTDMLVRCPPNLPVIALAEGGYLAVCQQLTKRVSQTIQILTPSPKLLSGSVLADLSSFIERNLPKPDDTFSGTIPSEAEERCRAIADFQFGKGAGVVLFPGRLKVKVPRRGPSMIYDANKRDLLATQLSSGYLRIQIDAAERLVKDKIVDFGRIYFDGEIIKGSSLFAAGVAKIEGEIRPGDVVAVLAQKSGKMLATAETIVDGQSMLTIRAGAVAKFLDKAGGSGS